MKNISGRSLQALSAILTSFLILGFAHLAWNGFISDSEIWSVTIAKNFRHEWYQPWVFSRIFFYAPLALATAPFETATAIFEAAKIVMVLNGLLILAFTFRLARCLSEGGRLGAVTPWLAVIFTLANSGFLNQGYRIRSDLFSCALVLLALEVTFRAPGRLAPKQLIFWVLPFLATPKAALHVFPAIGILEQAKERRRILLIFFLGFFASILIFPTAATFFLDTYAHPEASKGFFSEQRFVYLGRVLTDNGIIVGALFFRFITWIIRVRIGAFSSDRQKSVHLGFGKFIIGSLAILVLSPEKVPFFVASFIPVLSVFASLLVDDTLAILKQSVPARRRGAYSALLFIFIFCTIMAVTMRAGLNWLAFRDNNNSHLQLSLIRGVEDYLNRFPKATYYDVVGLVPQRATIRLFAGPNDPVANRNSLLTLEHFYKPDIIIWVRKMHYLKPGIVTFILAEYFPIGTNAYARWNRLPSPLPLPIKKKADLEPLIDQMKKWAGVSEVAEFTALVRTPGKPDRVMQLKPEDLLKTKTIGIKSHLVAISPFTKIGPVTEILPEIIRFDWDWTGAADTEEILEQKAPE